jgi:hypothetical protein
MISPEIRAQIRRYFHAEHWKIGTIASELGVHPETVRNAIEAQRPSSTQVLRPSIVDPSADCIRPMLDQHPRLLATRISRRLATLVMPAASSVAARSGPPAPPVPRAVPASGNFSRRAAAGRLGEFRPPGVVLLRDDIAAFACLEPGVLLRSDHRELLARPSANLSGVEGSPAAGMDDFIPKPIIKTGGPR